MARLKLTQQQLDEERELARRLSPTAKMFPEKKQPQEGNSNEKTSKKVDAKKTQLTKEQLDQQLELARSMSPTAKMFPKKKQEQDDQAETIMRNLQRRGKSPDQE